MARRDDGCYPGGGGGGLEGRKSVTLFLDRKVMLVRSASPALYVAYVFTHYRFAPYL